MDSHLIKPTELNILNFTKAHIHIHIDYTLVNILPTFVMPFLIYTSAHIYPSIDVIQTDIHIQPLDTNAHIPILLVA